MADRQRILAGITKVFFQCITAFALKHLKEYSIVDFIEDDGKAVAVVPHKWLSESQKFCFYPKEGGTKLSEAFQDPDDTWDFLPCILRKTYDSYSEARQRLRRAEETDGLESAAEQGKGKRRKTTNSKYLVNDDSDDSSSNNNYEDMMNKNIAELKSSLKEKWGEENIPVKKTGKDSKGKTRKKIPKTNNKTDVLTAAEKRIAARARMLAAQKISTKSKLKAAVKSSSKPTVRARWSVNSKTVPAVIKPPSTSVHFAALKEAALLKLSKSQQSPKRHIIIERSNKITQLKPTDSPITSESLQHALNGIWSAIESLTKKQEIIILTQSNIETKLDKVLKSLRATDACKKPVDWPIELPLQSLSDMYKFELSLNEAKFMEFAVDYFSTCGGKTSKEMARTVCISFFSKSLASTINLIGTPNKTGIQNMKILNMILDACKLALNKKFELKKVKAAVGVWLRNQSCSKEDDDGIDISDND